MSTYLNLAQLVVSVLIIICVLLQTREGGLSTLLGGGGEVYATRRGLEKIIFQCTVILSIIFLLLGIVRLMVR